MKLVAHYSLLHRVANQPAPELPDLNPLITHWCGQRVRRIDRYIQLCLAGALGCVEDRTLPVETGVYIATRSGAVSTTATSMRHTEALGLPPKPMHFVNTLGNSAGYYLTQLLGINGGALVVSQEQLSFEAAVLHAWLDLKLGRISTALVGGFDEVVPPTTQHLERLEVREPCLALYEGSHWLLLEPQSDDGLDLEQPQWFSTLEELHRWLSVLPASARVQTSFIPDTIERALFNALGLVCQSFAPEGGCPHGTFSGAALTSLVGDTLTALGTTANAGKGSGTKEQTGMGLRVHIARSDQPPYAAIPISF
ncbi:beta-ketoacyl synthase N-terminal-like domain-containing protein [Marinimicrobium sp. ARAG 43.8]|uniref:beta-ketoacyl synthase N-terminal-like domain-containing protein n=1 Tax=Marinimicrobium sp. ARAG 43.8 TaxID=3418719 RepID=UPI003CF46ECC